MAYRLDENVGGLIPAHAGKTVDDDAWPVDDGAHPRSRGENDLVAEFLTARPGSSPLTRGKRPGVRRLLRRPGLIPAHAGKTATSLSSYQAIRAHPRSRGENAGLLAEAFARAGSSPLTRGKLVVSRLQRLVDGLIPAHAGKTRVSRLSQRFRGAHPRSRGENTPVSTCIISPRGSSPLTRGKPCLVWLAVGRAGLIPAHAGKTPPRKPPWTSTWAHPRSRGENTRSPFPIGNGWGSSPLTRGKLLLLVGRLFAYGLIPAHAGKTPRCYYARAVP